MSTEEHFPWHKLIAASEDKKRPMHAAKWYARWPIHNLIAHPLSEILYWCHLESVGNRFHDATIPPHQEGKGRG